MSQPQIQNNIPDIYIEMFKYPSQPPEARTLAGDWRNFSALVQFHARHINIFNEMATCYGTPLSEAKLSHYADVSSWIYFFGNTSRFPFKDPEPGVHPAWMPRQYQKPLEEPVAVPAPVSATINIEKAIVPYNVAAAAGNIPNIAVPLGYQSVVAANISVANAAPPAAPVRVPRLKPIIYGVARARMDNIEKKISGGHLPSLPPHTGAFGYNFEGYPLKSMRPSNPAVFPAVSGQDQAYYHAFCEVFKNSPVRFYYLRSTNESIQALNELILWFDFENDASLSNITHRGLIDFCYRFLGQYLANGAIHPRGFNIIGNYWNQYIREIPLSSTAKALLGGGGFAAQAGHVPRHRRYRVD